MIRLCRLVPILVCAACGPALEDHIEQLGGGPEERLRVEDPRIVAVLQNCLLWDKDPEVRARIAHKLGAQELPETADTFLRGLDL